MDYEKLCMYCFQERGNADVCPHCGRDSRAAVPQIQILPGTRVFHNRFMIGRALGQDATGIVYSAYDTKRDNVLRVREYMPRDCAERTTEGTVVPVAGMEDRFEIGMKKLKASVESVSDPAKRHFYFEENGTAYIAQRRSATPAGKAAAAKAEKEENESSRKMLMVIFGALAAIVIIVAVMIGLLNNRQTNTDITVAPSASANSENVWTPLETATPEATGAATSGTVIGFTTPTATAQPTENATVQPAATAQPTNAPVTTIDPSLYSATDMPTTAPSGGSSGGSGGSSGGSGGSSSTPTAVPTQAVYGNGGTVWSGSTKEEITALQTRLAELGWLASDKVTGTYGSLTKNAVKSFQKYINDNYNPTEELDEDGIAGPKTQEWLYRVNAYKPGQATSVPTSAPAVTATPRPSVTAEPSTGTVDENSSREEILYVQQQLVELGMLSDGSADGKWGSKTRDAIRLFQQFVNQTEGVTILSEDGKADALTLAYIQTYVEWQRTQGITTPEPTLAPTDAPGDTTPEPEEPEVEEGDDDITPDSPSESIRYMQQMLMSIGVPGVSSADGIYGSKTSAAILAFQQWVNEVTGGSSVPETGSMDKETLRYLQSAYDYGYTYGQPITRATEEPERPEEGDEVDDDSDSESVRYVQELLISVGYLRSGSADGSYGDNTTTAVRRFQQRVNELLGDGTVPVTGQCDSLTLQYLEYFSAQGSIAPTQEPETDEGGDGEGDTDEGGDEEADEPEIDADAEAPTISVSTGSSRVNFSWNSSSNVKSYDIVIRSGAGSEVYSVSGYKDTEGHLDKDMFEAGETYTVTITANLKDGGTARSSYSFTMAGGSDGDDGDSKATQEPLEDGGLGEFGAEEVNNNSETETAKAVSNARISVNGVDASGVIELSGDTIRCDWGADGSVDSYSFYLADSSGNQVFSSEGIRNDSGTFEAASLMPGEVYSMTIVAYAADGSTDSHTIRVMVPDEDDTGDSAVGEPRISIGGTAYNEDGVPHITGTSATFSWQANGDVDHYTVYLKNTDGDRWSMGDTDSTSYTFSLSEVPSGDYTLYVGAAATKDADEDEIVWSQYRFVIDG